MYVLLFCNFDISPAPIIISPKMVNGKGNNEDDVDVEVRVYYS